MATKHVVTIVNDRKGRALGALTSTENLSAAEEAQRLDDAARHAAEAPELLRRRHHKSKRAAVERYLEDNDIPLESDLTPAQLAELRAIIRDVPVPRGGRARDR